METRIGTGAKNIFSDCHMIENECIATDWTEIMSANLCLYLMCTLKINVLAYFTVSQALQGAKGYESNLEKRAHAHAGKWEEREVRVESRDLSTKKNEFHARCS